MTPITAFDYPTQKHVRRHGPSGYSHYDSYREWLRDEFHFRCVFCLKREQWDLLHASFHIDHIVPQSIDPNRACEYDNLLYVCASCNSIKSHLIVPSPCDVAFGNCVMVRHDGTITWQNETGRRLVQLLRLDDQERTKYRKLWFDTWMALMSSGHLATYTKWMSYPEHLPDLSAKAPPSNSRPEGVDQSAFARRKRGELPTSY